MRTALHSWSLRGFWEGESFDLFRAIDLAGESGFAGFEVIGGAANWPGGDFRTEELSAVEAVMRHVEDAGVSITASFVFNDFANVEDEAARRADIEYVQKWLRIAADVGVPTLSMLPGK